MPDGGATIDNGFCCAAFTVTGIDAVVEFAGDAESVALMSTEVVPAAVGVPVILQPFKARPAGRFPPATAQV